MGWGMQLRRVLPASTEQGREKQQGQRTMVCKHVCLCECSCVIVKSKYVHTIYPHLHFSVTPS